MTNELRRRLTAALALPQGTSSDFDLNPDIVLPPGRALRDAGVLIAVTTGQAAPRVVLTRRSSALRHHPRQIAFPGGKVDPMDEGAIGAALREAEEEVGLPRSSVEILGTLPSHETVSGFLVTPVVAMVAEDFVPVIERGEVDEAFDVPLHHLAAPEAYVVQARRWRGAWRHYYAVPYGPYYIWGATARILRGLADRLSS